MCHLFHINNYFWLFEERLWATISIWDSHPKSSLCSVHLPHKPPYARCQESQLHPWFGPHCPESLGKGCANTGSRRACCAFCLVSSHRQHRLSKWWQCLQLEHNVPKGAIFQVWHLMVWTCAETPRGQCPESGHTHVSHLPGCGFCMPSWHS